jgi:hypothetical protein
LKNYTLELIFSITQIKNDNSFIGNNIDNTHPNKTTSDFNHDFDAFAFICGVECVQSLGECTVYLCEINGFKSTLRVM